MRCSYLLEVEKDVCHPGGTALRGEAMTPSDRCGLKPKKDNFGMLYDVFRWVSSGGSPVTVAHPCSSNCPGKTMRGGKREGAGRPPGTTKKDNRKKLSITLPVHLVEWLRKQDLSQAKTIEAALKYWIERGR